MQIEPKMLAMSGVQKLSVLHPFKILQIILDMRRFYL